MKIKCAILLFAIVLSIGPGLARLALAETPQTHDVPMFHNDDGLGLLQDCIFLKAIANGKISEVPTTVNARSTNCLAAIKSVLQVIYSLEKSSGKPEICIPSIEPDWYDILEHVTAFMQKQSDNRLGETTYGVWIMRALRERYPCS